MFLDDFIGFAAAHIYPCAYEEDWERRGCRRWVARNAEELNGASSLIDSPHNGFLVSSNLHQKWDAYRISVNPDVFCPFPNPYKCLY